jgi:hypothetical protein
LHVGNIHSAWRQSVFLHGLAPCGDMACLQPCAWR